MKKERKIESCGDMPHDIHLTKNVTPHGFRLALVEKC